LPKSVTFVTIDNVVATHVNYVMQLAVTNQQLRAVCAHEVLHAIKDCIFMHRWPDVDHHGLAAMFVFDQCVYGFVELIAIPGTKNTPAIVAVDHAF
jgi:hypothetical protein